MATVPLTSGAVDVYAHASRWNPSHVLVSWQDDEWHQQWAWIPAGNVRRVNDSEWDIEEYRRCPGKLRGVRWVDRLPGFLPVEAASPSICLMTQDRWKSVVEWPLVCAALVFLAAYSVQVIADLTGAQAAVLDLVIGVTWAAFVVDYLVMLALARRRGRWFLLNIHELAILALPVLRPLRLLRLVTLLKVLHRTAGNALRGRIVVFVLGAAVLLTYCGALAVLDAEKYEPEANILTFWDALWWALTTITTVGYGDRFPVTGTGRVVAGALMLSGIAVVGVVTASVASWLVEHVTAGATAAAETQEEPMRQQIRELTAQVERLSAQIQDMAGGPSAAEPGPPKALAGSPAGEWPPPASA